MAAKKVTVAKVSAPDLFGAAAPTLAGSKAKKSDAKDEIDLGDDLDIVAAAKILIANLESLVNASDAKIRETVADTFVDKMFDSKKRPDTFYGFGTEAKATCTLARKSSAYSLKPEAVELLKRFNVPLEEKADIEERYVFCPEVLENPEYRNAINEALANHPKLKGVLVVAKQPAKTKTVASDESLDFVAQKINDKQLMKQLLMEMTNISVGKFILDEQTMARATEILKAKKIL